MAVDSKRVGSHDFNTILFRLSCRGRTSHDTYGESKDHWLRPTAVFFGFYSATIMFIAECVPQRAAGRSSFPRDFALFALSAPRRRQAKTMPFCWWLCLPFPHPFIYVVPGGQIGGFSSYILRDFSVAAHAACFARMPEPGGQVNERLTPANKYKTQNWYSDVREDGVALREPIPRTAARSSPLQPTNAPTRNTYINGSNLYKRNTHRNGSNRADENL